MGKRKYLGSVSIDVDVDEVLDMIDEDAILEYLGKSDAPKLLDFATLDELEFCIRHGKTAAAYAIIEGWRSNLRIADDVRAKAYAEAMKAGHA